MKRLATLIALLTLCMHSVITAQDIHFSQWSRFPIQYNPARSGFFDGDIRAGGLYRSQWSSVTVPYRTAAVYADAPLTFFGTHLPKGIGSGLLIHQDVAGDGILRRLSVRLSGSYRRTLNTDSVHFISAGFALGFGHRTIDFNRLRFDSQFDGDVFDPSFSNGENFSSPTHSWLDLGLGFGWEKIGSVTQWTAGIGFLHLNRPTDPFAGAYEQRPVLTQASLMVRHPLSESLTLLPQFSLMLQAGATECIAGAELRLHNNTTSAATAAGIGLHYRWNDAIVPAIYLYRGKFSYGFSYDLNVSDLRTASRGRGGPEISVVYTARKIKAEPQRRVICPVY